MLGFLSSLFGGGTLTAAKGIAETFVGNATARQEQQHTEQMAVLNQFASEFIAARPNRTWWDSLVDGLNRLPRPVMTFGTIGLFAWVVIDPIAFTEAMVALSAVPEPLWMILVTIIAFWFGGKILQKDLPARWRVNPDAASKALETAGRMVEGREQRAAARSLAMDPDDYDAELVDTSSPLSNRAILEWNRRRQAQERQRQ